MDATQMKLGLEIPAHYETYFQPEKMGGDCSRPILGSVIFMNSAEERPIELNELKIRLVRVLSISAEQHCNDREPIVGRLSRWIKSTASKCNQDCAESAAKNCSVIEELTMHTPHLGSDSQVGYSPEEGRMYKIPFHMPVPSNLPPTSKTDLGQVSYFIVASAKTTRGQNSAASQEIALCRKTTPEHETSQHTRAYPNSKLVTKIILTQELPQSSKSNIPLSAEVFIRQPTKPADRPNEYKCVAVRGVQWRIEEVSRTFYRSEHDERDLERPPVEDRTSVREIAKGFQKGYWKTLQSPITAEEPSDCDDFSVEIPLDIAMPNVGKVAPEIEMSCYDTVFQPVDSLPLSLGGPPSTMPSRQMMFTIEHRIKLDILTTEDTFDVSRHQLVDRKPLRTALNASFPLQIIDRTEGSMEELLSQGNPPRYEEVTLSPPGYDHS